MVDVLAELEAAVEQGGGVDLLPAHPDFPAGVVARVQVKQNGIE